MGDTGVAIAISSINIRFHTMCVSVCVRVCLCYGKKSQFQNRIWTVAVHTSELETISLPVDGRCIGTKLLLGASETGILCFGAAHQFHTRFM